MFGSGFDVGWTAADIVTQLTNLLSNTSIDALVVGILALAVAPRVIRLFKQAVGRR